MSVDNETVVAAFCRSWTSNNIEKAMSYLAPDCFYHNMPLEPCIGAAAIRAFLEPILTGARPIFAGVDILHTSSSGAMVMNERVDRFVRGERTLALPVFGAFEVRDGKIVAWRDYFDLAPFSKFME